MEQITYLDACDFIAQAWNKESELKLTGEQVFDKFSQHFPALHIGYLYEVAKDGHLSGMLMCEPTYAKAFCEMLEPA